MRGGTDAPLNRSMYSTTESLSMGLFRMPSPSCGTCLKTSALPIFPLPAFIECHDDDLCHLGHRLSLVHAYLSYPRERLCLAHAFALHQKALGLFNELSSLKRIFQVLVLFAQSRKFAEPRYGKLHSRRYLFAPDGLHQIGHYPCVGRPLYGLLVVAAGKEHDGRRAAPAYLFSRLYAVLAWHLDIHYEEVRRIEPADTEGFSPACPLCHEDKSGILDESLQDQSFRGVIVYNRYSSHALYR